MNAKLDTVGFFATLQSMSAPQTLAEMVAPALTGWLATIVRARVALLAKSELESSIFFIVEVSRYFLKVVEL